MSIAKTLTRVALVAGMVSSSFFSLYGKADEDDYHVGIIFAQENNQQSDSENEKYHAFLPGIVKTEKPEQERPNWSYEQLLQPLYQGSEYENKVYLTFDDGYGYRWEILDILNQYDVKASFSLLGKLMAIDPEFVKAAADSGHVICNHTWNHANLTYLSDSEIAYELNTTDNLVKEITGRSTKPCMRPPYGAGVNFWEPGNYRIRKAIADNGFRPIMWDDYDPMDWKGRNPDALVSEAIYYAHNGMIYLYHFSRYSTVQALPRIIEGLKSMGYEFATFDELPSDR